jgi:Ca2+-binding RTX toxin-like protein
MLDRIRILLPSLVAGLAVAAFLAPTASADSHVTVVLNENTGVLSITGTDDHNDYATVSGPTASVLKVNIKNWEAAAFTANCTEGGGQGDWMVTCPAANAKQISFDGKSLHDSFINNTSLPSDAHGGPGIDHFYGGSGPDVFYGGADADKLIGNGGDDTVDGGTATDELAGGAGTDIASWADSQNSVFASLDGVANDGNSGENETIPADIEGIQGGPYDDKLTGTGAGNDTLRGGGGADDLEGWGGDDTLSGDAGNDMLHPNSGADVLDGGPDADTLSYAGVGASVYVYQDGAANDGTLGEHDNVTNVENLTGSSYGDDLQGTTGDDVIHGNKGNDKIDAFFGDDAIYGGDGYDNLSAGPGMPADCGNTGCTKFDTDTISGGADGDTVDYSPRSDDLTIRIDGSGKSGGYMENDALSGIEDANGGEGDDTIYGNDLPNSLIGGGGNDGIDGKGGNDSLSGEGGNDWLGGGPGNDWITGGEGADTLSAPGGNDTLYGGNGRDLVSYWGATSGVTAHIGTGTSGQTGEADAIQSDVEDLQGSFYDDKLYGNGGQNHLIGLAGKDNLVGNGKADFLEGNEGADTLSSNGDGAQDKSACGAGGDTANADATDTVAADCETVHKS